MTEPMMPSYGFDRESRQEAVNLLPVSTARASMSPRTRVVTVGLTSLLGFPLLNQCLFRFYIPMSIRRISFSRKAE